MSIFLLQACEPSRLQTLTFKQTADSPNVNERRLPSTPLVAQKQLGALKTAMIKVGWLAAVGAVDASEALGHGFSR